MCFTVKHCVSADSRTTVIYTVSLVKIQVTCTCTIFMYFMYCNLRGKLSVLLLVPIDLVTRYFADFFSNKTHDLVLKHDAMFRQKTNQNKPKKTFSSNFSPQKFLCFLFFLKTAAL